jgi:uncharacterized lipoprotein YmbA
VKIRALALACVTACALTSKSTPRELRYFSPEAAVEAHRAAHAAVARVRLGRITPADHLRGAIVHRDSTVELAPYETLRWSESPEVYVRRALSRSLFDARPLEQAIGGDAATLDVEIVSFEEVRRADKRSGRVELRYVLHDGRRVLDRGMVTAEHASGDPRIEAVVAEIGVALEDAAGQIGDRVVAAAPAQQVPD